MSTPTPISGPPCPTCRCRTCICNDVCNTCGQVRRVHPNNGCLALANRRRLTLKAERDEALRQRDQLAAILAEARDGLDHWSTVDLDGLIDRIDTLLGRDRT